MLGSQTRLFIFNKMLGLFVTFSFFSRRSHYPNHAAGPGYRLAFKRIFGLAWTSGMTNTPTMTPSESAVASKGIECVEHCKHYERSEQTEQCIQRA
jgi:hypothetical protein